MNRFELADLVRIREGFYLRGESVAAWARAYGFKPNLVYQVLNGRCHARRGDSHRIALALGLKSDESQSSVQKEAPTYWRLPM